MAPDDIARCSWCTDDPLYRRYHDLEWGRPLADDVRLFEKICLEGFQSGLSWLTILRKRENFRKAFSGFEPSAVARFNARSVERLMQDAGIVRNRTKIEAAINNARRYRELVTDPGSLATYLWSYDDPLLLSRDLKSRGWTFVGPTTVYSMMQSAGIVNDHEPACAVRTEVEGERRAFTPP